MDGLFLVGLQCQALLPQEASARGQDLKELIQSPVSGRYTNHADKGEEINHRLGFLVPHNEYWDLNLKEHRALAWEVDSECVLWLALVA